MQDHDKDVDDEYFSELYASLKPEQPSSELDEKILKEAREATVTNDVRELIPKKAGGPFSGKWSVPVSLAAVMVLSVTVVVMIEHDRPYSLTSLPEPTRQEQQVQEQQVQAKERSNPAAVPQATPRLAKKSEQSVDEQAGTVRSQPPQPARDVSQIAPASAPPAVIENDKESGDRGVARSIAGVHTKSKYPEGVVPPEEAPRATKSRPSQVTANIESTESTDKTETPPRLKLVETEATKKQEPAPTLVEPAQDEIVAEAAPAAEMKTQTELQTRIAKVKDDAEKTASEQRKPAKTAATPTAVQSQVENSGTVTAEATAKNEIAAQSQTRPQADLQPDPQTKSQPKPLAESQSGAQTESIAAAVTGESTLSASRSFVATDENAPASVARSGPAQARTVPEEANVALLDDGQREPATQTSQTPGPAAAEADSDTENEAKRDTKSETATVASKSNPEAESEEQEQGPTEGSPPAFSAAALAPADMTDNSGLESQCQQMSQPDCLASSACILQQQVDDKSYVCRAASNACETDFSQALTGKELCEQRPGCSYRPANCYCLPGQDCPCTGGTPAMCVPESANH